MCFTMYVVCLFCGVRADPANFQLRRGGGVKPRRKRVNNWYPFLNAMIIKKGLQPLDPPIVCFNNNVLPTSIKKKNVLKIKMKTKQYEICEWKKPYQEAI